MSSVVNLVTSSNSIFQVQQKDGGKGWVIAVICGFCFGINISVTSNYALFYDVMISVYNSTENNVVYSGAYIFIEEYFRNLFFQLIFISSLDRFDCNRNRICIFVCWKYIS